MNILSREYTFTRRKADDDDDEKERQTQKRGRPLWLHNTISVLLPIGHVIVRQIDNSIKKRRFKKTKTHTTTIL